MFMISVTAVAVLGIGGEAVFSDQLFTKEDASEPKGIITVYKSPQCGCCANYVAYLRGKGYEVAMETVEDMQSIKEENNIPHNMLSCHTAIAGNYFIEGHMPIEAVEKMLEEKPAIDGIALPGMPAGSPGMGGFKRGPFAIYAVSEGESSDYITQ